MKTFDALSGFRIDSSSTMKETQTDYPVNIHSLHTMLKEKYDILNDLKRFPKSSKSI